MIVKTPSTWLALATQTSTAQTPSAANTEFTDHKRFKSQLGNQQRRALTRLRNTPAMVRLFIHFGCIAALSILVLAEVTLWPVLMLPLGMLLVFLFTLLHETVHNTAFRTGWVNRGVAMLCGFILFLPPLWFQYFHWAHHRHTQIKGKDPELDSTKPETLMQYLIHVSGLPVWQSHLSTLATLALGKRSDDFLPIGIRPRARRQAILMCVCYLLAGAICIIAGTDLLLFIWIIPMILGQPFLRMYLLAEHGACPQISNMFQNTRTTFTNRIVRLFAWNMPFHTEHHVYPTVPFHRLPELHVLMKEHLEVTEQGYVRFNRKYAAEIDG